MQFRNNPGMGVVQTVAAAISQYLLVKFDGSLCAADATKDFIGVTTEPRTLAQSQGGVSVPVRFTKAGTIPCTAAGAITKGDIVYKAASGKVGTTNTNARVGIALETVTADGDYLEVLAD